MTQQRASLPVVMHAHQTLPVLFAPDAQAAKRVLEFFTANIRNPHTRKAYARAVKACKG